MRFSTWEAQGDPLTCCKYGLNRMKVLIVRNPFARLESFFKMFVWESEHEGTLHNVYRQPWNPPFQLRTLSGDDTWGHAAPTGTWDDFPTIIQAVLSTPDDQLNFHAMSQIGLWADSQGFAAEYDPKEFFVLHLETLHEELPKMLEILCASFGYCANISLPEQYNSMPEKSRSPERWPSRLV